MDPLHVPGGGSDPRAEVLRAQELGLTAILEHMAHGPIGIGDFLLDDRAPVGLRLPFPPLEDPTGDGRRVADPRGRRMFGPIYRDEFSRRGTLTRTSRYTNFVCMGKRNVTITLDDETARWARVEAARRGTSVSQLVGSLLREHMEREESYEAAKKSYLAVKPRALKRRGRYPTRDEIHRREGAG